MMRPAASVEERAVLLTYIAGKVGVMPANLIGTLPFQVASVIRGGRPMGAVLYTNFRRYSVEMIVAGEPGWITRSSIRAAFHYPFVTLGAWTVLAMTNRRNSESRELQKRIGFIEQGVIQTSPSRAEDMILYSMTRDRCRWLDDGAQLQEAA
jgi:hypothetical protein